MENRDCEYEKLCRDWKKCFSKSRQRDYYFNEKTGESLWTWEEVVNKIRKKLNIKSEKPMTSQTNDDSDVAMIDLSIEEENQESDPMEIEIAEDIYRLRFDPNTHLNYNMTLIPNLIKNNLNQTEIDLLIVLDTNIFISNLDHLKKMSQKYTDRVLFSIPWVVVQELDNLKSKKSIDKSVLINQKAQESIKFINSILSLSNFLFETFNQYQDVTDGLECLNNDDRILKCAIRLRQEYSKSRVILASNDINLINKSIICQIEAFNFKHLRTCLTHLKDEIKKPLNISLNENELLPNCDLFSDILMKNLAQSLTEIIETRLKNVILKSLSYFFEYEMKKVYDDLWMDLLLHKPPWTLVTLIPKCLMHYKISEYNEMEFKNCPIFDRVKCLIKGSSVLITFYDMFDKSNYESIFGDMLKSLDIYQKFALKLCQTLTQIIEINSCADITKESNLNSINNFHLIELIFEKYQALSSISSDLVNKSDRIITILRNDCNLSLEYSLISQTIKYFNLFYEYCLKELSLDNLIRLSNIIYIMYKLLDMMNFLNDQHQSSNNSNELYNYLVIQSALKSCFYDHRERMLNGFLQFKEFEKRFDLIDHSDFINFLFE
ncbi:unnamed protein product [Brachionus calyciflorus]|uniref:WW domain-containing protein n=1 Tax=Brachionus calyciflorus TaxID=104777 RepID=A0A813WXS2_9BILA|nr:unnamed protein product [Brachionus calyciflorus]